MRIGDVISDVFSSDLVDILVNNAGSSPIAPSSLETNEQLFDRVLSLNFKGPFRLSALVGSRMAAGDGGSIINVSSAGALRPRPQIAPYAGAKAALNAVTTAFRSEEHTSELQSLMRISYAVFCLKKKQ